MTARSAIRACALILLVAAAASLWHQRYRESLPAHDIQSLMAKESIPGAVLAVRDASGGTRVVAYGRSAAPGGTLNAGTRFPIASLSKPITASAVRRLIARGALAPDDAASAWLPMLGQGADPRMARITVRQLLQHTSGLGDASDPLFDGEQVQGCDRAIDTVLQRRLDSPPGSVMRYSNIGYCMLGKLIERVTGQDYATATADLLDLPATTSLTLGPPSGLSHQGHGLAPGDWQLLGAAGGWFGDAGALAAIFATDAQDPSIPAMPVDGHQSTSYYGLGWRVWPTAAGYRLTHFGILPGMFSLAVSFPDGCSAVIVMNGRPRSQETFAASLAAFLERELPHPHGNGQ